jgi:hypothetical protein
MRAELVRVIGGPTGAGLGVRGPTGPQSLLVPGPVGLVGATGRHGPTGWAGIAGLFTGLMGMTGLPGPAASEGYPGGLGPVGPSRITFDDSYIAYFQNLDGYSGFTPLAVSVGCKFRYTLKGGPNLKSFYCVCFNAQFISTVDKIFNVGISQGTGDAPNAGVWSGYPNNSCTIYLPGTPRKQIPFFIMLLGSTNPDVFTDDASASLRDRWFDLVASSGTSSFDPAGGTIKNVSCVIFEVPI